MDLPFKPMLNRYFPRQIAICSVMFLTAAAVLMSACSSGSESNNAMSNANKPPTNTTNTMSNTATNSTANTMSNTARTGNIGLPNTVVDTETLTEALRTQLSHDNPREMPADHAPDNWLDSNIGSYYKYDDEVTKLTVCKVTEKTLKNAGMKMTSYAKEKLYRKVTAHSSCRQALGEMAKATLSSSPINPVP